MAVGEGRTFSAPHGIQWSKVNNNSTRKEKKLKKDSKMSSFEAFCELGDREKAIKSAQAIFAGFERLEVCGPIVCTPVQEKPPRVRRKSSNTTLLDIRLSKKKSEKLDYSYVSVKETDLEKSMRERLIREVKQQNWMENETNTQVGSPLSCPNLSQRKTIGRVYDENKNFSNKSLISFNPRPQYCNRLLHVGKDEFSKQFCDVLGPGLCADCTKSQMQQFVIDEHTRNFPDICVSPYVLCVPQESGRDVNTAFTIYRECDPLQRRRPSTILQTHDKNGLKTRPNSCNNDKACGGFRASSPLEATACMETPASSLYSSRRSSISKSLTELKNEAQRETESGTEEDAKPSVSSSIRQSMRRVRISPVPQSSRTENKNENKYSANLLNPNCFSKRKLGARSTARSAGKTPSISRTGKLSELPYWKFLIPEPPMMEVGRMNVSIYTPKQIPGIKIFDESFFDI